MTDLAAWTCPDCKGEGKRYKGSIGDWWQCKRCGGRGVIKAGVSHPAAEGELARALRRAEQWRALAERAEGFVSSHDGWDATGTVDASEWLSDLKALRGQR